MQTQLSHAWHTSGTTALRVKPSWPAAQASSERAKGTWCQPCSADHSRMIVLMLLNLSAHQLERRPCSAVLTCATLQAADSAHAGSDREVRAGGGASSCGWLRIRKCVPLISHPTSPELLLSPGPWAGNLQLWLARRPDLTLEFHPAVPERVLTSSRRWAGLPADWGPGKCV